ncbi:MAG: asparaginase [Aquincola sp.]|nr:asparaginase [Aquincola sp.]MDH4287385.1 asparaginase [Aquincola sp.]MDH5330223.1 asparaginase [Aquincola sp.]
MASSKVVILGTGGTIAGTAASATDAVGYAAAQLGVAQLVAAVPALASRSLECEQVAQLDSKDMDHATWQRLAQRAAHHLARPDVAGVVVTHGTDTLEETAYLLHRVLAPAKPLVLTAAMRPATALMTDGPQNLLDAVTVALDAQAGGVVVAFGGRVWAGAEVRKVHTYRIDAFAAGDAGPLATVEEGSVRWSRAAPKTQALGLAAIAADPARWPRVEIVLNHAGAGGMLVDALVAQGVQGVVVAGTGNGAVHHVLEAALLRAQGAGVRVLRSTRCASGPVIGEAALPSAGALTAVQARVELMLQMLPTE